MTESNSQQIGEMVAKIENLTKTVDKLNDKIDAQATEIQKLKTTITSLKAGGRVLLWVAGTLGAALGLVSTWAWRIWQASQ